MNFTPLQYSEYLAREKARKAASGQPVECCEREADLHEAILRECARRGWLPIHGRMDCASSVTVGAPDFVIMTDGFPSVLFVECKTRTGKLSPKQQAFHAWAAKLGHQVHVVRSIEEFLKL